MSSSSSPFDASASALGYLYQCRYALLLALQKGDDPNQCLSIEKLDDVAFHESPSSPTVAKECLQFKHKINRVGGLGDSSPDIWKTLKIWAEGVKQKRFDLDRVTLFLVTTASAGNRNSVRLLRHDPSSRKPLEALQNLESAATKSTNPIVQDALASFLTLTSDDRRKLFSAIYLLDNAPSVLNLDQQFTAIVRYAALPQHRDAFLQRIEGWWLQRIVMHLSDQSPGVISVVEVQQQFHEIREQFRRDSLPDDMFSAQLPPEATPDADDRVFVRQLRLINLSLARLRNAQEDTVSSNPLATLQEERENLLSAARALQNEIDAARSFATAEDGYSAEATDHKNRLTAIGLYRDEPDGNKCPLCEHDLSAAVPKAGAIQTSLANLERQMNAATRQRPRLEAFLNQRENRLSDIRQRRTENKAAIEALIARKRACSNSETGWSSRLVSSGASVCFWRVCGLVNLTAAFRPRSINCGARLKLLKQVCLMTWWRTA